jgi:hypothetical protein
MGRKGPRFHAAALAENAAVAEHVLERIRVQGPLSSLDFERETGPTKDWFGMPGNPMPTNAQLPKTPCIACIGND